MTHQGGHLWGHGARPAPRGCREDRGPKPPNPPGKHCAGPPRNSPSTVFFLKKDAMVRHRSQAARFGPARCATGRGQGGGQALGGFGKARPKDRRTGGEGRVSRQDRRGRYPRSLPPPTRRRSGDCELRHFLRSHFWAAPARCPPRLRTEAPEAAAAALTSAAARSSRVRGPGAATPRGLAEVADRGGRGPARGPSCTRAPC